LLHTAVQWFRGKVTMFPHLPFNELLNSPTYLHISLASYLYSNLNNPSCTNDPTSSPHRTTVQTIRKTKQQSDQAIWPANKNSKKYCGQTNKLLQPRI
jgi:hypothetical protein